MIPLTMSNNLSGSGLWALGSRLWALGRRSLGARRPRLQAGSPEARSPKPLLVLFAERLDLDVHACRQVELHQRVHRLRCRFEDVDQPLVRADLELLPRLLVDVG